MSETGHLPTDVESSDRDPGAVTLQPRPYPPSPLLGLPGSLLSFSFSSPDASEPSDSLHQESLSATPPYVNRIQYSPPASGPPSDRRVFFEYKKHCAFQEKRSNTDVF
ncbi:hypothetical protein ALC60_12989 [Trachymyrmex zeteki]|uniref:Uncharacterized protein n=1 Tax=Mycetomoellerius zeteki TaxID=64791 RepID=A0A151WJI5_9HYME|nr:hypothetical protein ALC60_12989 [Trachymyrmex zeteki]